MSKRKDREKHMREQYIIDIAEELFLKNGLSNTTMDDISKNCELSKTTVYKYFQSKDELEILVYKKIHAVKMQFLISEIEKREGAYGKLLAFGNAYRQFFSENKSSLQFQLTQDYLGINKEKIRKEILDDLNEFLNRDVIYLNSIFKQGVDENVFRKDLDSETTLELFYLTLRSVLNQVLFINSEPQTGLNERKTLDKYDLMLNIFLEGIKAK